MKRHPICNELRIPEPERADIERIAEDMHENGWDQRYPSFVYQNRILVGYTREAAAKLAGVKPHRKAFKGSYEQAVAFCLRSELIRRHMTTEQQQAVRDARIPRVAELRAEGKSQRQIAAEVGVSQPQVAADIQAATDKGLSVDPPGGRITGQDGKRRDATKPKPRCARCARLFPKTNDSVAGCTACAAEREAHKAGRTEPGTHEPNRLRGKAKGGAPGFDWRSFHACFGQLFRQIDTFGRLYGVIESDEAKNLRDELSTFLTHFKAWTVNVSKLPVREF